jgi:hypothetical protein
LDAVLIGNAAAALQGSPVTTMDFDFMFRKTQTNLTKLKRIADDPRVMVLRPYYAASQLYRMTQERDGLHLDFQRRSMGSDRSNRCAVVRRRSNSAAMNCVWPRWLTSSRARNAPVESRISWCCPC